MMSLIEKASFLAGVSIFQGLPTADLHLLARQCGEKQVLKGETVMNAGDFTGIFYVIAQGAMRVTVDLGGRETRLVATLHEGEYFGEVSVFDDEPHSATVTATEDSMLLYLNRQILLEFIHENPEIALGMLRVYSARLRKMNMLEKGR